MYPTDSKSTVGIRSIHWLNGLTTFSFAVLFSSLTLYLTGVLKLSNEFSNSLVSLFLALNFALHLLAGFVGGRFLSNRVLYLISLLFQVAGIQLLSTLNSDYLFWGLCFFLIGCGFNSTCLSCMLTQQFESDDHRRESSFFVNYCAMNAGFFTGFLASGLFELRENYQHLFYLCNVINLFTLVVLIYAWRYLGDKNTPLEKACNDLNGLHQGVFFKYSIIGSVLMVLLIPALLIGFQQADLINDLVLILGVVALGFILNAAHKNKNIQEKNKIYAFLILTVASVIFWMLFFVGPMGMIQFLKYNAHTRIFNCNIPPQWILNLNTLFVITGSPLLAIFFAQLRKRGYKIHISTQFVTALMVIAFSFYLLSVGIYFADSSGKSSALWIILHFLTQALGELLIAPVGYAMIGRLAPTHLQGIMMGAWMMVSGVAAILSNHFSNAMTPNSSIEPFVTNPYYAHTFNQLGLYALVGAFALYLLSSRVNQYVNQQPEPLNEEPVPEFGDPSLRSG